MNYEKSALKIVNNYFPKVDQTVDWVCAMEVLLQKVKTGEISPLKLENFLNK